VLVLAVLVCTCLFASVDANAAAIKRVLILGDSWAQFMYNDRGFRDALIEKGLPEFEEWNNITNNTALGGTHASDWAANVNGMLDNARSELQAEPTIDIVWVTLGGNDLMSEWRAWDGQAQEDLEFDAIANQVKYVIEQLLLIRPTIRVVWSSYDYMNCIKRYNGNDASCYNWLHSNYPTLWPLDITDPARPIEEGDLSPEQAQKFLQILNEASLRLGVKCKNVALTMNPNRVRYVSNFGVLQIKFGYPGNPPAWLSPFVGQPDHIPHWDPAGVDAFRFAAGTTAYPMPGQYPDYTIFAGGDSSFTKSPWEALMAPAIDDWIHLSKSGHDAIAGHCLDVIMTEWLLNPIGNPAAIGISAGTVSGNKEVEYEVVFNKPVTGVDTTDFIVSLTGGLESAEVTAVAPIDEVGAKAEFYRKYSVLVELGAGGGTARLDITDNDSIVDGDGNKLGGTGNGNGNFTAGESAQVYGVPVAAWPAALLLAGLGAALARRRNR
jgi:hypothetical protein